MTEIAFFGHDAADAAVRRRARAFEDDGLKVTGYMMRRREGRHADWDTVDLGLTRDGAFVQRVRQIFAGASIAAADRNQLARADLVYARNLDMLGSAFLAKRKAKLKTPVVYECLDVHRLLTRSDPIGWIMRAIERALLKRCRALVVSSPGFLENYFAKRHAGLYDAHLIENRMAAGADYGARPSDANMPQPGKLRIGWIGNLRCAKSFDALIALADRFPDQIEIRLHGQPARKEIPVFEPEIDTRPNVTYFGRYTAPEDLPAIYEGVDLVWAGDYMEAGYNSVWLLPNRIYEGGYYATPPIAPSGTQTAAWIDTRGTGFLIDEPIAQSLPALVETLLEDPTPVVTKARALLARSEAEFIQPKGEMAAFVAGILKRETAQ